MSDNDLHRLRRRLAVGVRLTCMENTLIPSRSGRVSTITQVHQTRVDIGDGQHISLPMRLTDVEWLDADTVRWQIDHIRARAVLPGETVTYRLPPWTEPGTLDLTERLSTNPGFRDDVIAARAQCDQAGHPPGGYNADSETTYCRCGFVQYEGDHAPPPQPRERPVVERQLPDPYWRTGR